MVTLVTLFETWFYPLCNLCMYIHVNADFNATYTQEIRVTLSIIYLIALLDVLFRSKFWDSHYFGAMKVWALKSKTMVPNEFKYVLSSI